MTSYQDILKRAQERQGRRQQRTLALLDGVFRFTDEDLAKGPDRVVEHVHESVELVNDFMAKQMSAAAKGAVEDVIDPVIKAAAGKARLPEKWDERAQRIVGFYIGQGQQHLELAATTYLRRLELLTQEAEAMAWSREVLIGAASGDIKAFGPRWGAYRADVRRAVVETTGHGWTSLWTAAWRALEVAPELIADVPATPFNVLEGGKKDEPGGAA